MYALVDHTSPDDVIYGEEIRMESDSVTEVESLQEFDVLDKIQNTVSILGLSHFQNITLKMRVRTNSVQAVGFMMHVQPMGSLGRYRILLGSITLIVIYLLLLLEVVNRAIVAFIGAFFTLLVVSFVTDAPSLSTVVSWMDSSTLCLLFGMMVMIQMLSTTGIFEYLAVSMFTFSNGNVLVLSISLCLLTGIISAFLDNVTTMLLIAPVTIELADIMKISPIPLLLPEVIYSNIGGTATQIGDPPNIIIGNMLSDHIGFVDFIYHMSPCALLCMVFVYIVVFFYFKDTLMKSKCNVDPMLRQKYPIKNKPLLLKCGTVLLFVIILFFLHSVHGIDTAFIAIAGAFACLLLGTNDDLHATFELLEWETLVFFAGLFIMIQGVSQMGVIRAIGNAVAVLIMKAPTKYQSLLAHMLLLWVAGLVSSVLDNIAFIATMIPVVKILANEPSLNLDITTLAWALAFGACFGGNGTLVGAGANLVTAGISTSKGYPITFGMFFKFGFPCMIVTLLISTIYVWIRYV